MRQTAMPLQVTEPLLGATEHPRSALGTPAIRRFDWARPPVTSKELRHVRPPGPRALSSQPAPARLSSWPSSPTSLRSLWSLRPNGKSEPNWSRPCAQTPGDGSRLHFEWIAFGCTNESFWTAPWRSITALESQLRCWRQGPTSAGSTESRIGVWPDSVPDPIRDRRS